MTAVGVGLFHFKGGEQAMLKRLTLLMAAGAVFYSAYPVALTINENTRYQEIDGFGFAEGAKDGSWNSAPSNVCPQ